MLCVDHSRHAQSPGSSLPGTRVAAHGKRAAPLLARFLLTAQGAGASGLFSAPGPARGRIGSVPGNDTLQLTVLLEGAAEGPTLEKRVKLQVCKI